MAAQPTPWRPPQWNNKAAMVSVTVPAGYTAPQSSGAVDPTTNTYTIAGATKQAATSYVFDAVIGLDHEQVLTKTRHPVQTSASISSHAYVEPAQLVLYVLMSDAAAQYVPSNQTNPPYATQFTGNKSKSVSAYQQMLTLQAARIPLTVTTRLRTYNNMLIMRLSPHEDHKTITGAKFRIEFEQIFVASTQVTPNSTRPNDTGTTGLGSANTQVPPASVDTQFQVHAYGTGPDGPSEAVPLPPDLHNGSTPVVDNGVPGYLVTTRPGYPPDFVPQYSNSVRKIDVPGAGNFSSVNTNALKQVPGLQIPGL
jgi:hypothetical protein